ncbi:MAG: hypothetical protein DRP63_01485 [Planctomycetota bacterium]|nr:MAG: hypothetical protein DRP63_01485 [Planctomycetota bacterium]
MNGNAEERLGFVVVRTPELVARGIVNERGWKLALRECGVGAKTRLSYGLFKEQTGMKSNTTSGQGERKPEQSIVPPHALAPDFYSILDDTGVNGMLISYENLPFREVCKHAGATPVVGEEKRIVLQAVGNILSRSHSLATALRSGGTFQIVGPKELLQRIARGEAEFVKVGGYMTGTVRDIPSGRIIGQGRFKKVAAGVAGKLARVGEFLWAVGNIIFSTIHLKNISERLQGIEYKLDRLLELEHTKRMAQIEVACQTAQELVEEFHASGSFTPDMMQRLVLADYEVRKVFSELRILYRKTQDEIEQILKDIKDEAKKRKKAWVLHASEIAQQGSEELRENLGLLLTSARGVINSAYLWLLHDMCCAPEKLHMRKARLDEVLQYSENVCRTVFSRLEKISRDARDAGRAISERRRWFNRVFDWLTGSKLRRSAEKLDNISQDMGETAKNYTDKVTSYRKKEASTGGYIVGYRKRWLRKEIVVCKVAPLPSAGAPEKAEPPDKE